VNELTEDISKFESELADYNVLKDWIQSKINSEDIQVNHNGLVENNKQLENELNKLFRERRDFQKLLTNKKKLH
jgi:hypothetical protein